MPKLTATQQRAKNAEKQKAYRAKQKAKVNVPLNTPDASEEDEGLPLASGDALEVDVIAEEQPVEERLSFFQRTMQRLQGDAVEQPKPRGRGRKSKENLLVTALPTVLASLICTYASQMLPDEYKACAPQQSEVTGILSPLMEIIGRRVEVVGKVNQDATDIISSIICAFMMSARMYITYIDIKKSQEYTPHAQNKQQSYDRSVERERAIYDEQPVDLSNGIRSYQNAAQRIANNGASHDEQPKNAYVSENDAQDNGADASFNSGQSELSEAEKVALLFKRDVQGRQQLGLLPVRV